MCSNFEFSKMIKRKNQLKPKANRRKEILKIRAEIETIDRNREN